MGWFDYSYADHEHETALQPEWETLVADLHAYSSSIVENADTDFRKDDKEAY